MTDIIFTACFFSYDRNRLESPPRTTNGYNVNYNYTQTWFTEDAFKV